MISVAMATYNGEKYIEKQLSSINQQIVKADEVIICDDRSSDNTVNIIKKFIKINNLENSWKVIINDKNLGFINNFIKAILLTTGDYIFLSDQDDIFYPNKFKVMMEYFENNPLCMLLNANYEIIDAEDKICETFRTRARVKRNIKFEKIDFRQWLFESSFPGFSMGFRACIREKLSKANLEACYGHDQLIGLFAIDKNGNYKIRDILSGYRIHLNNTTGGKNITENYSLSLRINQKEKEKEEYIKLETLIKNNDIRNVDLDFLKLRKAELEKRIEYLKKRKLFSLLCMAIKSKAYPKGTILGDCIYIIKGKK